MAYAVPTANWQATYRVVLPDHEGSPALLQVWALVHNSSDEDWDHVQMTLATGAPLSFAFHLRTPSFTARPDASGAMQTPTVNGPVLSEETRARELERNAVRFESDELAAGDGLSNGQTHEGNGAEDRDGDGIVDASDRCPSDTETFNGIDDGDGCPDHGRVMVTAEQIQILQRAAAVRARLLSQGISAERVRVRSFGSTRAVDANSTPEGRARNRTVTFRVMGSEGSGTTASPNPNANTGAVTVRAMRGAAANNATTHESMGVTRFEVSAPVSIASSTAALVTLASREVPGEDVYLYRPEPAAPSSRLHPYRAARLRNATGMTLLPGPVALFSGGTFAGEGLLQRLTDGETTFIPYAIDPSTDVAVVAEDAREPARVVSVLRNVVTLEDTGIHRTRYTIDAGAQAPTRLYLRHEHLEGYEPRNLPPDSERGRGADLVPVPLSVRQQSVVTLEQTHAVRFTLSLSDDLGTDVAPYLAGTPDRIRGPLRAVLDQRSALAQSERQSDEIREQLSDLAQRNAELRETLRTLTNVTDAARVELRTRVSRQLQESLARLATLSHELDTRTATASTLRTNLMDALRGMHLDPEAPAESGNAPTPAAPSVRP